jgi:hypothetical protein
MALESRWYGNNGVCEEHSYAMRPQKFPDFHKRNFGREIVRDRKGKSNSN